jgi:hypothetical protein
MESLDRMRRVGRCGHYGCPSNFAILRRLGFVIEQAAYVGFHGVAWYDQGMDATALLALECAVVEADRSRFNLRKDHPRLMAPRTTLPDIGKMGWRYRLIFRHSTPLMGGSVTELSVTEIANGREGGDVG